MDMNIQFTANPYNGKDVISRGVTVDAKIAKLNNITKRPVLVAKWEQGMPKEMPQVVSKEEPKDYSSLLENLGMTTVEYAKEANNSGAKKLRVNKIVNEKTSKVYENSEKTSLTPQEEVVNLINQISITPAPVEAKEEVKEEVHGRHEKTGEVPVTDIRDAIRQELTGAIPVVSSRMERNASSHENVEFKEETPKEEPKATDMDLYNNLIHGDKAVDDVSRQLQGAREELSIEKEESKKLAEQYSKAVRELEELKVDVENKKRAKAQQEKRELTETLNNIKTLKEENLAKTSDLSSIQAEIAKLKAEKEAMESVMYDDSRSFGRRAA